GRNGQTLVRSVAGSGEDLLNSWINLIDPSEEEMERIAQEWELPLDFFHDALDANERPRAEKEENALLLIFKMPFKDIENKKLPYGTVPFGMILTANVIITICKTDHPVLHKFVESYHKNFAEAQPVPLATELLLCTARYYLRYLNEVDQAIDAAENVVQTSMHNDDFYTLLYLNKSLVLFTTAVRGNMAVIHKLLRPNYLDFAGEDIDNDKDLLRDVLIEMQQAQDTAEIYSSTVNNMMDAYAGVIQNNINTALKILTSFTVILSVPTMVATIYGMNVPLPMQTQPWAFWALMGGSFVVSLWLAKIFMKKRWI
ncbi:MAG: magnesium transporter CorA family protein, partial [Firmicutes bacterium]|nr:magnesium transporter CorA family protein [Bacillota bacterium]